jgi:hypothetical protein
MHKNDCRRKKKKEEKPLPQKMLHDARAKAYQISDVSV